MVCWCSLTNTVLQLVGAAFIVYHVYTKLIQRFMTGLKTKDLKKTYGEGWALVTGATDGIGKGFCEELAKRGFNVCVFGRNQEKTQKVCQEIQALNKSIKVKPIIADFTNCIKEDSFIDNIKAQLKTTIGSERVALLVNNVGIQQAGLIRDKSYQWYKDIISVNTGSQVLMTKLVTEEYMTAGRKDKKFKQGIINIASFVSEVIAAGDADYCAAKTFNNVFSKACHYELAEDNITVLSIKPLYVSTAMTHFIKGNGAVTPQVCASSSLNHLEEVVETNASFMHKIQSYVASILPESFVSKQILAFNKKYIRSLKRKAERKAQQQKKDE